MVLGYLMAARSQWFIVHTALSPGGGVGAHSRQPVIGAQTTLLSGASPELLTAVHSPGAPHSQQSRPLRRRQSPSTPHFENSGTWRTSKTSQRPLVQRAPKKGFGAGMQASHGGGNGQICWRNCCTDLALTPTNSPMFATTQASQQPLY